MGNNNSSSRTVDMDQDHPPPARQDNPSSTQQADPPPPPQNHNLLDEIFVFSAGMHSPLISPLDTTTLNPPLRTRGEGSRRNAISGHTPNLEPISEFMDATPSPPPHLLDNHSHRMTYSSLQDFVRNGLIYHLSPPEGEGEMCDCCYATYADDPTEIIVETKSCTKGHVFHLKCLLVWLRVENKNTCPKCRNKLFSDDRLVDLPWAHGPVLGRLGRERPMPGTFSMFLDELEFDAPWIDLDGGRVRQQEEADAAHGTANGLTRDYGIQFLPSAVNVPPHHGQQRTNSTRNNGQHIPSDRDTQVRQERVQSLFQQLRRERSHQRSYDEEVRAEARRRRSNAENDTGSGAESGTERTTASGRGILRAPTHVPFERVPRFVICGNQAYGERFDSLRNTQHGRYAQDRVASNDELRHATSTMASTPLSHYALERRERRNGLLSGGQNVPIAESLGSGDETQDIAMHRRDHPQPTNEAETAMELPEHLEQERVQRRLMQIEDEIRSNVAFQRTAHPASSARAQAQLVMDGLQRREREIRNRLQEFAPREQQREDTSLAAVERLRLTGREAREDLQGSEMGPPGTDRATGMSRPRLPVPWPADVARGRRGRDNNHHGSNFLEELDSRLAAVEQRTQRRVRCRSRRQPVLPIAQREVEQELASIPREEPERAERISDLTPSYVQDLEELDTELRAIPETYEAWRREWYHDNGRG